ncbi:MAG TPA: C-terminal binding protein [Chloroflexota bacterium]
MTPVGHTDGRPLVVILDTDFPSNEIEHRVLTEAGCELRIADCRTEEDVVAAAGEADGVIVQYAPLTRRSLGGLSRCRIVTRYGIGMDNIDIPAATELGIWVANVPGFCAPEVSDHGLALVLAFGRRLFALDRSVRDGRWDIVGVAGQTRRVAESTLGIVGFGTIGRMLATKAAGLGLRVLAHSPRSAPRLAAEHGAEAVDLTTLLRESDYLVLLCPLRPETHHLIRRETLALMRPSAHLINLSRGALVDEAELARALADGRLAGAGLDVFEREPLPADSPLRRLPNVILSPHGAYYSSRALAELQERVARNVVDGLAGRPPGSLLNPEVGWRGASS